MENEVPLQGASSSVTALALRVIALIDLTDLNDARRPDALEGLISDAVEHGVAAVCVWPEFVAASVELLRSTDRVDGNSPLPLVATVVNFPHGTGAIDDVVAEANTALDDGADEIDLVLPYHHVQAGDLAPAQAMVAAIADVVHQREGHHLKVILETGELGNADLIGLAARCAIEQGADFIKTSTGKTPISATTAAVDSMIDAVEAAGRPIGLKPSGGIRTVAEAARYLELVDRRLGPSWATPATFRFGASGLLADAVAAAS